MIVDTHCHLYAEEFNDDRAAMIDRAVSAGVGLFMLPNIDSGSVASMIALCDQHPQLIYPMIGLHPCSVKQNWEEELKIISELLTHNLTRKFCGIGETGLDYYWDKAFILEQKENFRRHIDWAKQLHLPIIIHSRDALDECIGMIKDNKGENLRGIFHCFSGSPEQARSIIDLGFFLGIGGTVTYKNSGTDKVVEQLSLDHIVLETDAPYLSPVPFRGKRNESSYLRLVVKKVAQIKKISEEEVEKVTTANALRVFQIDSLNMQQFQ